MRADSSALVGCVALSVVAGSCSTAPPPPGAGAILGLKAVVYAAPDDGNAAAWYARLLGTDARESAFGDAAFQVGSGGVELDLDSRAQARTLAVWEVADIDAAFARVLALGAEPVTGIQEIGAARLAIVRDPFGNLLGLTEAAPEPAR
jgi:predicted enzyme related to lactoylglutathione lyase